jgi:hypothetical protein
MKFVPVLVIVLAVFSSCKKGADAPGPGGDYALSYGDSIIYPINTSGDYIVHPVKPLAGTYEAFPEGIELDERTGAINVSESETGLRYRITFTPDGATQSYTTVVLLAGINYLDQFYNLSRNDTLARVIYNGDPAKPVPVSSGKTVFDIDLGCNKEGIAINQGNGTINLAQTIRNGFFGRHPDNDSRQEFELEYKIDDKSKQKKQSIKIKLYYHDTMADVDDDLFELLEDREGNILRSNGYPGNELVAKVAGVNGIQGKERPRPPCIFIIGR